MMNSGDRLLVVKAGGLRKLISKVEEAFLGVDDEIGAGFDTMPLSAADKTSSPQSAPTPPPTAAAPLPKHAAPTPVGTSAPGLIAAPNAVSWFVGKAAPAEPRTPERAAVPVSPEATSAVSWFVTKTAPAPADEHPPLTPKKSPSTVLATPVRLPSALRIPVPTSSMQHVPTASGPNTVNRAVVLCLLVVSGLWWLSVISPSVTVAFVCFAIGVLAGARPDPAQSYTRQHSPSASGGDGSTGDVHEGDDGDAADVAAAASEQLAQDDSHDPSDERYAAAAATARKLSGLPNADQLKLYALFKQAESGDAPSKGPSRLNAVAYAKWQAWDAKRGLARGGARAHYVELVEVTSYFKIRNTLSRQCNLLVSFQKQKDSLVTCSA